MIVLFLLTNVPSPRLNKRIKVFLEKGFDVHVVCTRRKSQDIYEPVFKNVEYSIYELDLPGVKHPFKRLRLSNVFKKIALSKMYEILPNMIYVNSVDTLSIARTFLKRTNNDFNKVKVFYEVADLRECFIEKPKNIIKRLIFWGINIVEKKSISIVSYLVLTSMKFYESHYFKIFDKDKVIYMPNIPDLSAFSNYSKKTSGNFVIGFIGGIRYLAQMKMLVDVSQILNVEVLFAGAGGTSSNFEEIIKYCDGKSNVKFTGKYNYYNEISSLYSKVDCVYSVYDADNPNVKIALPNKLYESVYCELPIIVAKGTYLSEIVEKYGIGCSVSHKDPSDLICAIRNLMTDENFNSQIVNNCKLAKKMVDLEKYNDVLIQKIFS